MPPPEPASPAAPVGTNGAKRETREEGRYGEAAFRSDGPAEPDRLDALADAYDPVSHDILQSIGLKPGWRCIEAGAGPGHMTRWIARKAAPAEVTAVDLDTAALARLTEPNIRTVCADLTQSLTADVVAPASFDLAYSRFTLLHLRERDEVLARMYDWLTPGGWLVISDSTDFAANSGITDYGTAMTAMWETLEKTIGTSRQWARRFPEQLARLGLTDLNLHAYLPVARNRNATAEIIRRTMIELRQKMVATGRMPDEALARLLDHLSTPEFLAFGFPMITTWGRKPS